MSKEKQMSFFLMEDQVTGIQEWCQSGQGNFFFRYNRSIYKVDITKLLKKIRKKINS